MMQRDKYHCLVVDDEPIARKIILNYIDQMPLLALAAECINAFDAIEYVRSHEQVDIIFLDINMPNLSGVELMRILQPQQPVIFTTAYTEYAVESYELNAADYLLKPFSFERFTKAVYKAVNVFAKSNGNPAALVQESNRTIFIKSDGKNYPVLIDDILYCEAMKNYTVVMLTTGQKLMPLVSLSKFETVLAGAGGSFIQVHRSYLISRKNITTITPTHVTVNTTEIPIGVQFKERFFKEIGMKEKE